MSGMGFYLCAFFLAGEILRQLLSGTAPGTWWRSIPNQQDKPVAYWFVLAVQEVSSLPFSEHGTNVVSSVGKSATSNQRV